MMLRKISKNKLATVNKRALSLRIVLVYSIVFLLIAVALTTGITSAWFTSGSGTDNQFTTGTLDIDIDGPYNFSGELIESDVIFDPTCAQLNYLINNAGSKRAYTRVKFEGHWERTFHENTAYATVGNYNLEASDSAHFKYGPNNQKEYSVSRDPDAVGFTDVDLIGPTVFESVPAQNEGIANGYSFDGSDSYGQYLLEFGNGDSGSIASGEVFRVEVDDPSFQFGGKDDPPDYPHIEQIQDIFGPSCLRLTSAVDGGGTHILEDGLKISITDNGDSFDFESHNYPIYHVFVKGGNAGDHFYAYYVDDDKLIEGGNSNYYVNVPTDITINFEDIENNTLAVDPSNLSEDGVYEGFGLQQIDGEWSHAKFLYCVPDLQPGIELVKLLSVDDGETWYTKRDYNPDSDYNRILDLLVDKYGYNLEDYNYDMDSNDWQTSGDVSPRFQIIVGNTGDVNLEGINVTDNYFETVNYSNINLTPGQLWFSPEIVYSDYLSALPVDLVTVKLQNSFNGWNPAKWSPNPGPIELGDYFYYNEIINSGVSLPLYIEVCLDETSLNKEYSGAVFTLYAFFEAVQTTSGLVDDNWPDNPY